MEHRALALAYRPQTFEDVAGQRHVTDVLSKAVENDRIAHAYLFSGPRGTGKTTTARILAKVLNCPNRKGAVPDNTCSSCRDITNGVSLDVVEIDGASNRGIADIQQLREKVRFAATGGGWKVYIIDEVHQLSSDAFAALLKTLEEPPPHVVFIFATTDPLKLPDTIRSRCQRYEFARVSVKTIVERLQHIAQAETKAGRKLVLEDAAAFLIARKAEGGMRDAVSALDQVVSTGRTKIDAEAVTEVLGLVSREAFFDLAEPIFRRDPAKTLAALHRAYGAGFDAKDLADGLLEHVRNVLVLMVDPNAGELLAATAEETERYKKQGAEHSSGDVLRMQRILTEAQLAMRESSQPLLHLETALLEMAHLEPGRTLAEILARLDAAGGGGAGGAGGGGGARASAPAPAPSKTPTAQPSRGRFDAPPTSASTSASSASSAGPPYAPPPYAPAPRMPEMRMSGASFGKDDGSPIGPADFDRPECWPQVVEKLLVRRRLLGHCLETARVMGWQGATLVLEVETAHRAIIEHKDHRVLLVTALEEVYGRALQYRCVPGSPVATSPAPAVAQAAPAPAFVEAASAPSTSGPAPVTTSTWAETAPPNLDEPPADAMLEPAGDAAPAAPPAPAPRRKHPAELSAGAQSAMVWLEGEIVGPPRPTP